MNTPRPAAIHSRRDAFLLWTHLLERRVAFHQDTDPAEWLDDEGRAALSIREVATFRRLIAEVDRLGATAFDCFADAQRLRELATLGVLGRNTNTETFPRAA
ncbi:MAG: hypothetical protein ACOZQL_18495 [Myxococcota bacterium]